MSRETLQREIDLQFDELEKLLDRASRDWVKINETSEYLRSLLKLLQNN